MNKLKTTYDGGFPFVLDDIRWIQTANERALASLARALVSYSGKETPVILYGAAVSNNGSDTVTISEGALYYNAEIWYIPAHSFSSPIPMQESPYWNLESSYDPAGDKIFYDGEMRQTYNVRLAKAAMTTTANAEVSLLWENTIRLEGMSTGKANLLPNTAAGVSERANRTIPSRVTKQQNVIHLDAGFTFNVNGTLGNPWIKLTTLPVGYRPLSYLEFYAAATQLYEPDNPDILFCCRIDVNGDLKVKYVTHDPYYQGVLFISINTSFNINL
jgi:hypothetical protein